MTLNQDWRPSLTGEAFSSSARFSLVAQTGGVRYRTTLLSEAVKAKSCLHVGCVDHPELMQSKLDRGEFLHEILSSSAERCGGVDINPTGIEQMRRRGYSELHVGDVSHPSDDLLKSGWDVLVLGEMIEHLDDPVMFLRDVRLAWPHAESFILSVPNAFNWRTLMMVGRGVEVINSDHRYWFTPYTICKVATSAGYEIVDLIMCESHPPKDFSIKSRVKRWGRDQLLSRRPILYENIVLFLEHAGR